MRTVPRLHFVYDASVTRGRRLSDLIEQAVAADETLHGGAGGED
jgi:ribosome-binding factor A